MHALIRTIAVMVKEVRQLSRDRLTFGMIVGIPVLQMVLFGYAINTDVRNLRAGYVDLADTSASRALIADIGASQVAAIEARFDDVRALEAAIRDGSVKLGIYVPRDFDQKLAAASEPAAQLLVDGSDPTIASIANRLTELPPSIGRRPAQAQRVGSVLAVRTYFNPERRSAVQIVPALIGVILTLTMVLFTAVAIVRERERGNFELLVTTPVTTIELMVGKIVPYIGIGLIQVTIVLLVGSLLFAVPVRGALLDLYLAALLFVMASLGLGLTISTIARSQFQAMQLTFFVFLPSILLSGFMFPYDGMPDVARWVGAVLPLTHFIELVRGIMLRGARLAELTSHLYALAAFFVAAMIIAIMRFAKRLD